MFDELTPDRLTAVERLWYAMFGKRVPPDPRMTPQRRQRARQMLRAVDARESGAIYRTVAKHLFPQHKIDAASWVGDPNRCAARTVLARETAETLADHDPPLLATTIGQRIVFADVVQTGRIAAEQDEDCPGAREIAALVAEVTRIVV